ncbi:MAG: hypothetical protein KDH94_05095, partial [Coxiellaceae bacterium]|nr:hypothetical protein [Coxiellaceae bacterium]
MQQPQVNDLSFYQTLINDVLPLLEQQAQLKSMRFVFYAPDGSLITEEDDLKRHQNGSYYFATSVENNVMVIRTLPYDSRLKSIDDAARRLLGRTYQDVPTQEDKMLHALDIIEFLVQHHDQFAVRVKDVAGMLRMVMAVFFTVSEDIKNRHSGIVPDTGWWLFELLAETFKQVHGNGEAAIKMLFTLMRSHIFEELAGLKAILLQMIDLERARNWSPDDGVQQFLHPVFLRNPAVVPQLVAVQNEIEQRLARGEDTTHYDKQQRQLIRQYQLQTPLHHLRFLATTHNNYQSIERLLVICEEATHIKGVGTLKEHYALCNILLRLGEYITHKKLANAFKDRYPGVDWEALDILRGYLPHLEEHDGMNTLRAILANSAMCQKILREIAGLKTALQKIKTREYDNVAFTYCQQYQRSYGHSVFAERHVIDKKSYNKLQQTPLCRGEQDGVLNSAFWKNLRERQVKAVSFARYAQLCRSQQLMTPDNLGKLKAEMHRVFLNTILQKMTVDRAQQFLSLLLTLDDENVVCLWLDVLNNEREYPSPAEISATLACVKRCCPDKMEDYCRLNYGLKPIEADLTMIRAAANQFRQHDAVEDVDKMIGLVIDVLEALRILVLHDIGMPELPKQQMIDGDDNGMADNFRFFAPVPAHEIDFDIDGVTNKLKSLMPDDSGNY